MLEVGEAPHGQAETFLPPQWGPTLGGASSCLPVVGSTLLGQLFFLCCLKVSNLGPVAVSEQCRND